MLERAEDLNSQLIRRFLREVLLQQQLRQPFRELLQVPRRHPGHLCEDLDLQRERWALQPHQQLGDGELLCALAPEHLGQVRRLQLDGELRVVRFELEAVDEAAELVARKRRQGLTDQIEGGCLLELVLLTAEALHGAKNELWIARLGEQGKQVQLEVQVVQASWLEQ